MSLIHICTWPNGGVDLTLLSGTYNLDMVNGLLVVFYPHPGGYSPTLPPKGGN